ncbi:MAG: class I SAM-dependent methyltransferase [Candidatus Omnitrophota bacterium]|jgi:ubiquinone/menaquinone biosynthesis C-methylase UbiE
MKEEKIGTLFDLVGSEFDKKDETFHAHYEQMARVCGVCFNRDEIEGKMILDAGCGTGTAALFFARNGAKMVTGVDLSAQSLSVGSRWAEHYKLGNLKFQKADILKMPFGDALFDAIFSIGALPYVEDVFAGIDEFARITAEGGTITLFLLKKGELDGVYEGCRRILCRFNKRAAKPMASILSVCLLPVAGLFLKRKIRAKGGKPLSQTILENLFSPVRLSRVDPAEVTRYLEKKGFDVREITEIQNVDFYSPGTIFLCKAKKRVRV